MVLDVLPYARAKTMTLEGELSGCFAMSWEPELKNKIVFGKRPLYQVKTVLLRRHGSKQRFHSLDDLPPKSILGIVKDYEYPSSVRAVVKHGCRIEETASEVQNLKKLAAGRIDATVVNCDRLKSLEFLLQQAGVANQVDSISIAGVLGSYVGFSLRNPSGLHAKEHFDKGMAVILKNKLFDMIIKNWAYNINELAK